MDRGHVAFGQAMEALLARIGLKPEAPADAGEIRLIVDGTCVVLADRPAACIAVEAEVLRLADGPAERDEQQIRALQINLGVLFDCRAALHRTGMEDEAHLQALALVPYTVNMTCTLIEAIEDVASLADLARKQLGGERFHSRRPFPHTSQILP